MDSPQHYLGFNDYRPCGDNYDLFVEKLLEETGWPKNFAELAIKEYVRFLVIVKEFGVKQTPSKVVDEVWHLHLQFTKDYWEHLCPNLLGHALHHVPTLRDKESSEKNMSQYQGTLKNYRELFGEPPADVWGKSQGYWVGEKKIEKSFGFDKQSLAVVPLAMILLFTIGTPGFSFFPSISGKDFLFFYGVLLFLFNLIVLLAKVASSVMRKQSYYIYGFIAGFLVLFCLGALRFAHGISHSYPVQGLFFEMLFGLVLLPAIIFCDWKNSGSKSSGSSSCGGDIGGSCSGGDGGGGGGCGGCGGD